LYYHRDGSKRDVESARSLLVSPAFVSSDKKLSIDVSEPQAEGSTLQKLTSLHSLKLEL